MTRVLAIASLLASGLLAQGQQSEAFTPPQAYPVERYETIWAKNPFTLKTAPAVVENVSFAKDLAIVSHYGDTANPTIVIVNTKTHERTRLKQGETASNGMRLANFTPGATRKETTVEVSLGSETSELKYNSEYMSQMAGAGGGASKTVPGLPANSTLRPGGLPVNPAVQQRGMPPGGGQRIPLPNGATAPAQRPVGVSSNIPKTQPQQRMVMPPGIAVGGGNNLNATGSGTDISLPPSPADNPAPGQAAGPLASNAGANSPTPPRRRLLR